jgi:WD40 repeat protein
MPARIHTASPATCVAMSWDATHVGVGMADGRAAVWEIKARRKIWEVDLWAPARYIAVSNTGAAAAASRDRLLFGPPRAPPAGIDLQGSAGLALSPDGALVAYSALNLEGVHVRKTCGGKLLHTLGNSMTLQSLLIIFSSDSSRIAIGGGAEVRVWELRGGRAATTCSHSSGDILPSSMAFTRNGEQVIRADVVRRPHIWSATRQSTAWAWPSRTPWGVARAAFWKGRASQVFFIARERRRRGAALRLLHSSETSRSLSTPVREFADGLAEFSPGGTHVVTCPAGGRDVEVSRLHPPPYDGSQDDMPIRELVSCI